MSVPLIAVASLFPWDSATDSLMAHRHLALGYGFAWTVQIAYLASILWRRRASRRAGAEPGINAADSSRQI